MSSITPTPQQMAAFQQVFTALFEFLEWTYGVTLSSHQCVAVQNRVASGWAHPDGSVRELLTYLGGLHTAIFSQPRSHRDLYRPQVQRIFASLFAATDPTERGQVLVLLHQILEQSRPTCTGVALRQPPQPVAPQQPAVGAIPGQGHRQLRPNRVRRPYPPTRRWLPRQRRPPIRPSASCRERAPIRTRYWPTYPMCTA